MTDHDPLAARLAGEADAYRPQAPAGLAERVIAAVRADLPPRLEPLRPRRRWPWLALPLAAGLAAAALLPLFAVRPETPVDPAPGPSTDELAKLQGIHAYLDLVFSNDDGTPAAWQRTLSQPFPNDLESLRRHAGEGSLLQYLPAGDDAQANVNGEG